MRRLSIMSSLVLLAACGDDSEREDAGDEGGLVTLTSGGGGSVGETEDNGTGQGTGNASGGGETLDDSGGGDGLPAFDVGPPDGGPACGGGMGGGDTLSHIWIANSPQGTVSKINTQTMIEEGRYIVRPDSAGNPSRTSVSLSGDVAVANRAGGVIKIYGNTDNCVESNMVPGLQTSSDGTALPWGEEECVAWYTPLAYSSNRPLAWAQGTWNSSTCSYDDEKLWTAGANGGGSSEVVLLDGETGVIEEVIPIPEIQHGWGLYGGAVDGDGHFWAIETGGGPRLVRVDRNAFTYQIWSGPGVSNYGIAVDSVGRPWFCAGGGASRFDPVAQTWQTQPSPGGNAWGGCMTDGAGTLWHARQMDNHLVGIDTETLAVVAQYPLPEYTHGISVDFDGYVWAVGFGSSNAYRVDPTTGLYDTFSNLIAAYTYSDMTGFALSSAGTPSG